MHDRALLGVREQLLRAGFAPRHVNRYVMELGDHLACLIAREKASGLDQKAAESKAREVLGTDAQLVQAMIDRGAPRSMATRAPWAVFGVLPFVALVALSIVLGVFSFSFFAPFREHTASAIPGAVQAAGTVITLIGSYGISLALAALCIAIALRQRLASKWVWVGLAVIALVSGPLGVHILFLQPTNGMPGGIRGSLIHTVQSAGRVDVQATLLVMAIRAGLLFALSALAFRMLRERMTTQSLD